MGSKKATKMSHRFYTTDSFYTKTHNNNTTKIQDHCMLVAFDFPES